MNDGACPPDDDPASVTAGTGAGLPGLRAKVERVGGSLRLVRDEDGTTLRCDIPLPRPPQDLEPPPRA
jgi:signal transduction histidine kinase